MKTFMIVTHDRFPDRTYTQEYTVDAILGCIEEGTVKVIPSDVEDFYAFRTSFARLLIPVDQILPQAIIAAISQRKKTTKF